MNKNSKNDYYALMLIFHKNADVRGGGGSENSDTCEQGGRGAKINGRPLWMAPYTFQ